MDVGRAFGYIFEDKDWVSKTIITIVVALLGILLIPLPLLIGYMVAIVRNVMRGDETLPEWRDWGQLWIDGLAIMIANFVYTLPLLILLGIAILPAAMSGSDSNAVNALGAVGMALSCVLGFILLIVLLVIQPTLLVIYARTGEFGSLFRFGEVLAFAKACTGPILTALLIGLVVSIVVALVAGVLSAIPCIGWLLELPLTVYPLMVMGHLYGQIGRQCQ